MQIKIIAAIANNNVIGGGGNNIPWDFHSEDMKIFASKTKSEGGVVLMGRKTFDSLPDKFKPLPNRRNIVITQDSNWSHDGVETFSNIGDMLNSLSSNGVETLWVCGGGQIYKYFMNLANELHISHFNIEPKDGIVFFPEIDHNIWEEIETKKYDIKNNSPNFVHKIYKRK